MLSAIGGGYSLPLPISSLGGSHNLITQQEKSVQHAQKVVVVPHNSDWATLYDWESLAIRPILGKNCKEIRHVGSTSVRGLAAKPIIDILVIVNNIAEVHEELTKLGYQALGELGIPFMRRFEKSSNGVGYKVMVFEEENPEIARLTKFRDRLVRDSKLCAEYAELKYRLADKFPNDIGSYIGGKSQFIQQVDAEEGTDVPRIVRDLSPPLIEECDKRLGPLPQGTLKVYNFLLIQSLKPLAVARILVSPTEIRIEVVGEKESHRKQLESLVKRWKELSGSDLL